VALLANVTSAFVSLGKKFANSIELVQPDETLPYIINTDASGRDFGVVLMQTNIDDETQIVSTASRVLTQTECRYSVAEQELLAIFFRVRQVQKLHFCLRSLLVHGQ
jgi:hypothetical protein